MIPLKRKLNIFLEGVSFMKKTGRKPLHGLAVKGKVHPLYNLYYGIKTRCYNASSHNYPFYQGKGIAMCDEWRDSVLNFYNWAIQAGWKQGLTIDRIDSDKNYTPLNCRFISRADNSKRTWENEQKKCRSILNLASRKKYSKLTIENVQEIKKMLNRGIKGVSIAQKFSVHKSCIYKIKHNKRWIEVEASSS